ncbi:transposase [Alcaligenaceae bacterium CGII-47]|nr:transposase [Alcaligenaceae bacterium CGII-47]
MEEDIKPSRPARRSYSLALKTQILQECSKPGVSIAGVALSHGINPNIVHKWRMNVRRGELVVPDTQGFIPVNVQAQPVVRGEQMTSPSATIQVEVQRGAVHARIRWPVQAGGECATWLRDLLR